MTLLPENAEGIFEEAGRDKQKSEREAGGSLPVIAS
jgi:hypothetical protein